MSDRRPIKEARHSLWNESPWVTRAGTILGVLTIAWGILLGVQLSGHLGSCGLPNNLTRPGLAMELANNRQEVTQIVGPCQGTHCMPNEGAKCSDGKEVCPDKISALERQQRLDYVFIVLYALFFIYIGVLNLRFSGIPFQEGDKPGKKWLSGISRWVGVVGGALVLFLTVFAAWWDWQENNRILEVLKDIPQLCSSDPIYVRCAAYYKWGAIFAAIGCASPLFIFWPGKTRRVAGKRKSLFVTLLAWLTALAALTSAFTGLAAFHYGQDQRLESAAGTLSVTLLLAVLTLALGQQWQKGLLNALNTLASKKGVKSFSTFLKDEEEKFENPAPDDTQDTSNQPSASS